MTKFYNPRLLPKAPKRPATRTPDREPSQHALDRANHLKAERHRAAAEKSGWRH